MAADLPEYWVDVRCDYDKAALTSNFSKRGWTRVSDSEYHFYWSSAVNAKKLFDPETGHRLADNQVINHFPNMYELTRKDHMVKNLKRYQKELDRGGHSLAAKGPDGRYVCLDIFPVTYTLPSDYNLFVEEFKRSPEGSSWIMKPAKGSLGSGIFIATRLSEIRRWSREAKESGQYTARDAYVVSRYIDNPLLIGGKKFDLRLYVLVTSYRPLRVYFYRLGFARFCTVKYESTGGDDDDGDDDNYNDLLKHLTNVAIQKHGDEYNNANGGKWDFENLLLYLSGTAGKEVSDNLVNDIKFVILHSLRAVQNVIINDKHCFECYGYDIIVDDNYKPWLVEVNASPSMSATTRNDRYTKHQLINDVLGIVIPPGFPDPAYCKGGPSANPEPSLGHFELMFDESINDWETAYNRWTGEGAATTSTADPGEGTSAGPSGRRGGSRRTGAWK